MTFMIEIDLERILWMLIRDLLSNVHLYSKGNRLNNR